jgi:hypothetical protein
MMLDIATERRLSTRRSYRGGGRRAIDLQDSSADTPTCPRCRKPGVASLAGESDGGWWFVCLACDHLWDRRQPDHEGLHVEEVSVEEVSESSFWRRWTGFDRRRAAPR